MTLASTSNVVLRSQAAPAIGSLPSSGSYKPVPILSESLVGNIEKKASGEINPNRLESDMQNVSNGASGDIKTRVRYATFDEWMAALLCSTWNVFGTNGVGAAVTVDVTTTTITAAVAPTGANAFTNLAKGQWFTIKSAGSNSGKVLRVSPSTAPTATVLTLDTSTPGTAATGESIQISTSRLTHGTTESYMVLEREQADLTDFYTYLGCRFGKYQLTISYGDLSEQSFSVMGHSEEASGTSLLPGSAVTMPDYDVHSHQSEAYAALWIDGAPFTASSAQKLVFSFDNKLSAAGAIYNNGSPVAITAKTIEAKLSLSLFLSNTTFHQKLKDNSDISVCFTTLDNDGNGYIFTLPRCKVSSSTTNASSRDQESMVEVELTMLEDRTAGKGIYIDRIGDAVTI